MVEGVDNELCHGLDINLFEACQESMLTHSCKITKALGFEKTIVGVTLNRIKVLLD